MYICERFTKLIHLWAINCNYRIFLLQSKKIIIIIFEMLWDNINEKNTKDFFEFNNATNGRHNGEGFGYARFSSGFCNGRFLRSLF